MNWLEVIRVRTLERPEKVREHFLRIRDQIGPVEGLLHMGLYTGLLSPTDLAVHLAWEGTRQPEEESKVALHLVLELEVFGLVDHTLWIREDGNPSGPGEKGREKARKGRGVGLERPQIKIHGKRGA